jgi:hypothetical protein
MYDRINLILLLWASVSAVYDKNPLRERKYFRAPTLDTTVTQHGTSICGIFEKV